MFGQKEKVEKIEKAGTFFRFEDLRIYNKSIDYVNWLNDVTMLFPTNDQSQFVLRFMDSARNISFFIAEGSARNRTQFIHYLKLAKSAIRECLVFTTLAYKQSSISELQEEESRQQLMEMTKMIGALISSLQRSSGSNGNGNGNNGGSNHKYTGKGNGHGSYRDRYDSYDEPNDIEDIGHDDQSQYN